MGLLKAQFRPFFLVFLALACIRWQVAVDLRLSLKQAWVAGIQAGLVHDFAIQLFGFALCLILQAILGLPTRISAPAVSFVIWTTALANAMYFRFFGTNLEWWTVQLHWNDLFALRGTATQLGLTPLLALSATWFVGAIALGLGVPPSPPLRLKTRFTNFGLSFCMLVAGLLLKQSPVWFHVINVSRDTIGSVLNTQILFRWQVEGFGLDRTAPRFYGGVKGFHDINEAKRTAPQALAAFRDLDVPPALSPYVAPPGASKEFPLMRTFHPDAALSQQWRTRLGLPAGKPLSVVIIFVESFRLYELMHPQIGPAVFPRFREVLAKHGLLFTQAYSSSLTAGQTERGKFSTLCSMLPDPLGPPTYAAHPTLRIRCLPDLLKEQGYQTASQVSDNRSFHNMGVFEPFHGIENFYDKSHFEARGLKRTVGAWGLDDYPFLEQAFLDQGKLHDQGNLFAAALTISTHHPYSIVPGYELPADLVTRAGSDPQGYAGFLGRFRYLDASLGNYFDLFFKSKMADDTIVVVLGDHSTPIKPGPVDQRTWRDLEFRITMAFVTKNMKNPGLWDIPAHQIDIAPTLADILNVGGTVTWLGRSLLRGPGSPWIYQDGASVSYRYHDRACYGLAEDAQVLCYKIKRGDDPMYSTKLESTGPDVERTEFFRRVLLANSETLAYGLLQPSRLESNAQAHAAPSN